ncbi:MAG: WbuC family cupin fold metalloprotein [Burkholderiales bacterium]
MNLRKLNEEVFIAEDPIVQIGDDQIVFLKQQAGASPRKRARICAHKSNDDALHEMVIAIAASSYIHPHKHLQKSESFHIVEGNVDVAVFDDVGNVIDVVELGTAGSGRRFFYRLSPGAFHTLLVRSDFIVMHEVTNGPFTSGGTALAPFAPSEDRTMEVGEYIKRTSDLVARHLQFKKST